MERLQKGSILQLVSASTVGCCAANLMQIRQNAYKSVKDFPGAANAKYASLDDARVAWFLGSTRARMGQTSSASPSRYAPTPGPAAQPDRFRTQASTAAVMESKVRPPTARAGQWTYH